MISYFAWIINDVYSDDLIKYIPGDMAKLKKQIASMGIPWAPY